MAHYFDPDWEIVQEVFEDVKSLHVPLLYDHILDVQPIGRKLVVVRRTSRRSRLMSDDPYMVAYWVLLRNSREKFLRESPKRASYETFSLPGVDADEYFGITPTAADLVEAVEGRTWGEASAMQRAHALWASPTSCKKCGGRMQFGSPDEICYACRAAEEAESEAEAEAEAEGQ